MPIGMGSKSGIFGSWSNSLIMNMKPQNDDEEHDYYYYDPAGDSSYDNASSVDPHGLFFR